MNYSKEDNMFSNAGGGGSGSLFLNKIQLLKSILCADLRKDIYLWGCCSDGSRNSLYRRFGWTGVSLDGPWASLRFSSCCNYLMNHKLVKEPGIGVKETWVQNSCSICKVGRVDWGCTLGHFVPWGLSIYGIRVPGIVRLLKISYNQILTKTDLYWSGKHVSKN